MNSPRSYHPFLVGVYSILFLYAHNSREVDLQELITPLVVVLATTCVLRWIVRRVVHDPLKADLLVTPLVVIIFAFIHIEYVYGCVVDAINTFIYGTPFFQLVTMRHVVLFSLLPAAFLVYLAARLKSAAKLTSVLNAASCAVVALSMVDVAWAAAREPRPHAQPKYKLAPETVAKVGALPNVFYIILDGYSRADFLKAEFGLDNEPFLGFLERKGFYVARRSTANYCYTSVSLGSSLNFSYLDELVDAQSEDLRHMRNLIGTNAVADYLRKFGYRYVTFESGYNITDHNDSDSRLTPENGSKLTNFQRLLVDATPLSNLNRQTRSDDYQSHRERILFTLDELPRLAKSTKPQFVFAHVLAAHSPFVFGEGGADVSTREKHYGLDEGSDYRRLGFKTRQEYRDRYRAQVEFLTEKVERAIEGILEASPIPPIIVLQSDHGSGLQLDPESMENTDLPSRLSILNAYYLPYGGRQDLYDSISPVNSFRVVLRNTFGARLDLLPDRSYFSRFSKPYEFHDVTIQVRSRPARSMDEAHLTDVGRWTINLR